MLSGQFIMFIFGIYASLASAQPFSAHASLISSRGILPAQRYFVPKYIGGSFHGPGPINDRKLRPPSEVQIAFAPSSTQLRLLSSPNNPLPPMVDIAERLDDPGLSLCLWTCSCLRDAHC